MPHAWLLLRAPPHGFLFCDHLLLLYSQASATELPWTEPTHRSRCSFPNLAQHQQKQTGRDRLAGPGSIRGPVFGKAMPLPGWMPGPRAALEEPHLSYGDLDNTSRVTVLIAHWGIWKNTSGPWVLETDADTWMSLQSAKTVLHAWQKPSDVT